MNVDQLLTPVGADDPCGPDLRYDPARMELEQLIQPPKESIVSTAPGEVSEPNWREVREKAAELLSKSKDLSVLVIASLAELREDGLGGFRDGLTGMRRLVEEHWEGVHPRLDPEDKDPTERLNIFGAFVTPPGTDGDPFMFVRRVRETGLTESVQLGRMSLRDIEVARGDVPAPAQTADSKPPPDQNLIDGAFADTPLETLKATLEAAKGALSELEALHKALEGKVGVGNVPPAGPLRTALEAIVKTVDEYVARQSGQAADGQPGASAGGRMGVGGVGDIRSSGDVLLALDKVCRYYELNEVSSPVPLILRAAQRMVNKSFLDITKVLTPDAIRLVADISGVQHEGSAAPEQSS